MNTLTDTQTHMYPIILPLLGASAAASSGLTIIIFMPLYVGAWGHISSLVQSVTFLRDLSLPFLVQI